jgi:hypothetical protein
MPPELIIPPDCRVIMLSEDIIPLDIIESELPAIMEEQVAEDIFDAFDSVSDVRIPAVTSIPELDQSFESEFDSPGRVIELSLVHKTSDKNAAIAMETIIGFFFILFLLLLMFIEPRANPERRVVLRGPD